MHPSVPSEGSAGGSSSSGSSSSSSSSPSSDEIRAIHLAGAVQVYAEYWAPWIARNPLNGQVYVGGWTRIDERRAKDLGGATPIGGSPKPRPGLATSEFGVTALLVVAGTALIVLGHENAGAAVLSAVGIGYPLARSVAKR